jgi:hypothetical protein
LTQLVSRSPPRLGCHWSSSPDDDADPFGPRTVRFPYQYLRSSEIILNLSSLSPTWCHPESS